MKVFDLQCIHGHTFEGWFGSEDDYQSQNADALVSCPFCGSTQINKLPAAPRLNLKSGRHSDEADTGNHLSNTLPAGSASHLPHDAMQSLWLKVVDHVMKNTEDVGERFAEEARRIHYGEVAERGIRGQTTPEEVQTLEEEGIEVMALPLPAAMKGTLQ